MSVNHNFRMMGDTMIELADRSDPNTPYVKVFTIHNKDAFMRFYNRMNAGRLPNSASKVDGMPLISTTKTKGTENEC